MEYQGFITKQGGRENPKSKTAHSNLFLENLALVWAALLCRKLIPKFDSNEQYHASPFSFSLLRCSQRTKPRQNTVRNENNPPAMHVPSPSVWKPFDVSWALGHTVFPDPEKTVPTALHV